MIDDLFPDTEKYELNFVGKKYAKWLTTTPITTRICSDLEHNNKEENKNSENIYIKGDSLEALKHLLKNYKGKMKCIYIDPPYNTGKKCFIYKDCFKYDVKTLLKMGLSQNKAKEIIKKHGKSTHSAWLTFMLPRLTLARDLLSDDGVIFISIDDNEQANLKGLCDEILGENNNIGNIVWLKGNAQNDAESLQKNHEYILIYKKSNAKLALDKITENKVFKDEFGFYYEGAGITTGGAGGTLNRRPNLGYTIYYNPRTKHKVAIADYDIELAKISNNEKEVYKDNTLYIEQGFIKIRPPKKSSHLGRWTWSIDKFNSEKDKILIKETKNGYSVIKKEYVHSEIVANKNNEQICRIVTQIPAKSFIDGVSSSQGTTELATIFKAKYFNYPKSVMLIKKIINLIDSDSIILDFFSGSATTAHACMQLNAEDGGNRKFILVNIQEKLKEDSEAYRAGYRTICDIGIERIKRAAKKIKEETKKEIDYGFKIYELNEKEIK